MQAPEAQPIPSTYRPEFAEEAHKLALARAPDDAMVEHFEIPLATFHEWLRSEPEFARAVRYGRKLGDLDTVDRFHQNTLGVALEAVKIFRPIGAETEPLRVPYILNRPPNTTAGMFWLTNRLPDQWRTKIEIEAKPSHENIRRLPRPELDRLIAALLAELSARGLATEGHS